MSKQVPQKKSVNTTMIHSAIGVAIMILFRFLPISLPEVTPVGMEIIGIFIGTLYLWTTVDPLWSSLMSVAMIGLSSYKPMAALLVEFMGNVTVIQMLFLMLLAGALVTNKITMYIGRFFLTRKITNGRPWMFTMMICIGCFLMAAFVSPFAPIFLFWPVLYDIFEEVGFQKGEKYPKIALILVVIATLIGFPVAPYMNNGLALIGNFKAISEAATGTAIIINDGAYLFTTLFMGILLIIAVILLSKFVFRPDVSKLKSLNVEMLKKNPLPPLNFFRYSPFLIFSAKGRLIGVRALAAGKLRRAALQGGKGDFQILPRLLLCKAAHGNHIAVAQCRPGKIQPDKGSTPPGRHGFNCHDRLFRSMNNGMNRFNFHLHQKAHAIVYLDVSFHIIPLRVAINYQFRHMGG